MSITFKAYNDSLIPAITDIWNKSMTEEYGFFPITPEQLKNHYNSSQRFAPERVLLAMYGDTPQGFIHYDLVNEPGYDRAGVICALCVLPEYRLQGVGDKLLSRAIQNLELQNIKFIDAAGAWPYSSFYATIIDGSERAGINENNHGAKWLLSNYYFYPGRRSYTMKKDLTMNKPFNILPQYIYTGSRKGCSTWLDHAFREWELFDHELLDKNGRILSRCIYSRMDGISDYQGRECYSLFGVYTPPEFQGMGYATANLKLLCNTLTEEGVEEIELHVYQDNTPALKLYRRIGFKEIGETVIMRRY